MTYASSAGVPAARAELNAHLALWIMLTAVFLCGMACLWLAGLRADFESMLLFVELITLSLLLAWMFRALGLAFPGSHMAFHATSRLQDFFLSVAQMLALFAVSALLIYLAANAGARFPLRDDSLEAFDALLGFDWHAVSRWLNSHPALDAFLLCFYNSFDIEILLVTVFGSIFRSGQRNSEFVAVFLTSILIASVLFAFVPAMGMFGKADVETLNRLLVIRAGNSVMDYNRTASIVSFPSYHAILAIILPYSVRHQCWSVAPALLVNVVILAATYPQGGHYLADILAGAAVATVSILVARRCLPRCKFEREHAGRVAQFHTRIENLAASTRLPSTRRNWGR